MKDIVKILPIGGQSEQGKNMYVISINEHMFIIDCGYRFPESDKLGVDVIIPSYDYLVEHKDQIEAIFITHGHDDTMAALPYLLEEIDVPIYTSRLTADLIEDMISHYNRKARAKIKPVIHRVHRKSVITVASVNIRLFPLTHSIPGNIGLAFETSEGYVVHMGEFIIDFGAPSYFKTDIQAMMEIGNKGVLALLCESIYANNAGYTSPNHKVFDILKPTFEEATGRIIIASYAQNVFRTKEIVDLARRYKRQIVFYGRDKYDNTNSIVRNLKNEEKPVIEIDEDMVADKNCVGDPRYDDNLVVLLTGNSTSLFHDINDIIDGGDERLKINAKDTFILACQSVPGTEKISSRAINELYKTDAKIVTFKNIKSLSMHASIEDIKVVLQVMQPRYYFPIRGEYQHFIANEEIAIDMGIPARNIVIMDNGEEITIENGELMPTRNFYEIEDVMIDGIGVGDVGDKVIDDRIQLSNDGVVIIGMTINSDREIVCFTDVQTRGFVYLKDSEHIVKGIINLAEEIMTKNQHNMEVDTNDIRGMIKDQTNKFIFKSTGKRPVILPVIIELK